MTEHDMWLTTPPEAPDDPPTCGRCRHFVYEVDEHGVCAIEADAMPGGCAALDWLDAHRRNEHSDGCGRWEEL